MAGIYVHIPFCRQKCHYCNFFSVASLRMQEGFFEVLDQEVLLQKDFLNGEVIETIYLGGGTPSLISRPRLTSLLATIRKTFPIDADAEITLEANPDDISAEGLRLYADLGINRLSLGVQSFSDTDLKYLHRSHNGLTALQALETIQRGGISNVSIDLIYGIPTLSLETWKQNLLEVVTSGVQHVSAYWLTVESGTALEKLIQSSRLPSPGEEEGIAQFRYLRNWAREHSWEAYELSNYASPGFLSRHNTSYWQGKKYLGLGPSAHSFDGIKRYGNISSLGKYKESLASGIVPCTSETLSKVDRYNEYIMTGLRTMWGIDISIIGKGFGPWFVARCTEAIHPFLLSGKVVQRDSTYTLTEEGLLISDYITSCLFIEAMTGEGR